jgi:Ras GTPase-activating-like protein IQGAP2/3
MTTLYMSMSANEKDLEIEDDLAKGTDPARNWLRKLLTHRKSTKNITRPEVQDILTVQEELCPRERRQISRFADRLVDPEPDGLGRGEWKNCICETLD